MAGDIRVWATSSQRAGRGRSCVGYEPVCGLRAYKALYSVRAVCGLRAHVVRGRGLVRGRSCGARAAQPHLLAMYRVLTVCWPHFLFPRAQGDLMDASDLMGDEEGEEGDEEGVWDMSGDDSSWDTSASQRYEL